MENESNISLGGTIILCKTFTQNFAQNYILGENNWEQANGDYYNK